MSESHSYYSQHDPNSSIKNTHDGISPFLDSGQILSEKNPQGVSPLVIPHTGKEYIPTFETEEVLNELSEDPEFVERLTNEGWANAYSEEVFSPMQVDDTLYRLSEIYRHEGEGLYCNMLGWLIRNGISRDAIRAIYDRFLGVEHEDEIANEELFTLTESTLHHAFTHEDDEFFEFVSVLPGQDFFAKHIEQYILSKKHTPLFAVRHFVAVAKRILQREYGATRVVGENEFSERMAEIIRLCRSRDDVKKALGFFAHSLSGMSYDELNHGWIASFLNDEKDNEGHFVVGDHFVRLVLSHNIGLEKMQYWGNLHLKNDEYALMESEQGINGVYFEDAIWHGEIYECGIGMLAMRTKHGLLVARETPEVRQIADEFSELRNQFHGQSANVPFAARDSLESALYKKYRDILDHFTPIDEGHFFVPGRVEQFTGDYAFLIDKEIQDIVWAETGMNISAMTLREQAAFLEYFKSLDGNEIKTLKRTIVFHKKGLARCLLVLNKDPELRKKVFQFAEESDWQFAYNVFDAFGKLVKHIDDSGDFLKETFGDLSTIHTNAVVEQLLERARKLLEEAVSLEAGNIDSFLQKIKIIDDDIALFTSACKALQKNSSFRVSEIEGVEISRKSAALLSSGEKAKLLSLQDQAYRSLYTPEFLASLREALNTTLENPNTHFYFLRKAAGGEEDIVSTLRFDEKDAVSNTKHMASFFTDPSYNGGAIGEALLDEALMREQADGSAVVLECSPHLAGFYQKHGFSETGRFDFKGESGVSMRKDPVMQPYTKLPDEETFAKQKTA